MVYGLNVNVQTARTGGVVYNLTVFTVFCLFLAYYTFDDDGPQRPIHRDTCTGSIRFSNYLEVYWLCAGELKAVNAIGTQLCDLM